MAMEVQHRRSIHRFLSCAGIRPAKQMARPRLPWQGLHRAGRTLAVIGNVGCEPPNRHTPRCFGAGTPSPLPAAVQDHAAPEPPAVSGMKVAAAVPPGRAALACPYGAAGNGMCRRGMGRDGGGRGCSQSKGRGGKGQRKGCGTESAHEISLSNWQPRAHTLGGDWENTMAGPCVSRDDLRVLVREANWRPGSMQVR